MNVSMSVRLIATPVGLPPTACMPLVTPRLFPDASYSAKSDWPSLSRLVRS
jgi:hypothetical protein